MTRRPDVRGVSLIEMLVVIVMIGLMLSIVVPRMRVSSSTKVRQAADQLVRDLELARTRALSTRSWTRVVFDQASSSYTGYLDLNRDSVFAQSAAERDSLRGFGSRTLGDGVQFGRAFSTTDVPSVPGAGVITFPANRLDFDARGLTNPFGTKGTIYLLLPSDPAAVAAVTVTAGAGIRSWVFNGATWR
jgi:prepilin-type N-terminal cleavage/methylation domain-containing protein